MTAKLNLYNSWNRRIEPFAPLEEGRAGIYACGPTVYDYAHIGNFRFNVWVDLLRRTLEWNGYDVTLVMNITDVDDKTIAGAARNGEALADYTARYAEAFFDDLEALRILPASCNPRATEHITDMVDLVETLIAKGLAYRQGDSIYFRVDAFEGYGKLSRLDPTQLRSTGRAEADAYDKESVRDFALWKGAKDDEPSWDTTLGNGRPGWHLECSAMSMKYLGKTFDMHLGGIDLMFPHHENEIAQSVGATGSEFARYWLHCDHLVVDGTKMSKSLGNQYTLRDLVDDGHDPVAVRYLLASVHYRKRLNFTFEALAQAKAAIGRLADLVQRLEHQMDELPEAVAGDKGGEAGEALGTAKAGFAAALNDDLNTSGALGHMFSLVRATNLALDGARLRRVDAADILAWLRDADRIWAVLPAAEELVERRVEIDGVTLVAVGPPVGEDLLELIEARIKARAARDFATADELRDRLLERGITVEDTAQGARWQVEGPSTG